MSRIKVMSIFGTRPEAIKMAPVVKALEQDARFESRVVATAQHREMLDQVMGLFEIVPDRDLGIMQANQTLTEITQRALGGLEQVFLEERPHIILVQGDTTTAFAATLAAFYQKVAVGHVEAGLRTDDIYNPFPEEMNRRLISVLGDVHFPPTELSRKHLLASGVKPQHIYLTGNTVIDAMQHILGAAQGALPPALVETKNRVLLVETHRRENLGRPMENVCKALKRLAEEFEDVEIAFSVHRNPKVREVVYGVLTDVPRVHLLEPMDYASLVQLMKKSYFTLTDSGGIQEEAPSLGVPALVLRTTTERPEGVDAGNARLVGTDEETVYEAAAQLLKDAAAYKRMSQAANPYGDGGAAQRIVQALAHHFGLTEERPAEFIPRAAAPNGAAHHVVA
ncbi:MAG: UDP-N-acetylglucosamine 2-epimerase (non-hydrolyzing) [Armatimonadetes bacterium]|nr:UDP-N-acetylglucosamine 2-epimerase (non-hydrolyzing) [Armatimonadota bacterium]